MRLQIQRCGFFLLQLKRNSMDLIFIFIFNNLRSIHETFLDYSGMIHL